MAIIISSVNDKRFSVNNIQYLKNYVTAVHGSMVEIFNCYERSDVVVPLAHYSTFRVNGVTYPNALALQAALLPVLYSRSNLGGDSPSVDQDNLDVVKHVRSATADPESIIAAINSVEMYVLDDKQSLWFAVVVPGYDVLNGRITNPNVYKYKMTNLGKGTYGRDAYPLTLNDIELICATRAGAHDIALLPDTQTLSYGTITGSIRTWFIVQSPVLQLRSNGYMLFEGTLNGLPTTYLWVGRDAPENTEIELPSTSDFLALGGVVPVTEQDNIDIKKTFHLESRNHNKTEVLALLNNLPPYTVNEKQSVWFAGSERVEMHLYLDRDLDNVIPRLNPLVVKYKMLNKGKGTYGAGQTQLVLNDIELVYSNEATLNDLESFSTTNIIEFTLEAGQSVSQWLNLQAPLVAIQPQEDGYTLFKSTAPQEDLSYLWIGEDGSYGSGGLQAAPKDLELLNETTPTVDQDNIDIKKTFTLPANFTTTTVLSKINSLITYRVSEKQSVWFVGQALRLITDIESARRAPVLICKYKMLNKGKGTYGLGGTQLTRNDIELIYTNEASLQDMETSAQTTIINVTLSEDQTISQWLNSQLPAILLKPQEDGYTIFKDTSGADERSWLWIGSDGNYGENYLESSATDFQILSNTSPTPFVPTLEQTVEAGNGIYNIPVEFNSASQQLAVSAQGLLHKDGFKAINMDFESGTLQNTNTVTLTIPAKLSNDVFAMQTDVHKPVKTITTSTDGFESGTYLLQPEDRDKWLLFKIVSDFIIKVPEGTFMPYTLIEGETADNGQATFVSDGLIILHHGASELPKTAERNSVFGLKYRSDTEVSLFGKLKML